MNQVHKSEKHGFEFTYPDKYQPHVFSSEDSVLDESIILQTSEDASQSESPYILINTYLNPDQLSLISFRDDVLSYSDVQESRQLSIAGQEAISFDAEGFYPFVIFLIAAPSANKIIRIEITISADSKADDPFFQDSQIITSSFRFL